MRSEFDYTMKKQLASGNEAVAYATFDEGVGFAASYPGTPSTEIIEYLKPLINAEWAVNEKVALENAFGASYAGMKSLAVMKQVGLNVASDALCTIAYTGVNAGLVIVVCDDPGPYSSQNEQDSRHYAKLAKVPLLEAYDTQSAYELTRVAFSLSEKYDTPVIVRLTTKICHTKSTLMRKRKKKQKLLPVPKNPAKYVMIPSHAKIRHEAVINRMKKLKDVSERLCIHPVKKSKKGLITTGVCYTYSKEFLSNYDILNIEVPWPFPEFKVRTFADKYQEIAVAEELGPFIADEVSKMGITFTNLGKQNGELAPDDLLGNNNSVKKISRHPTMCIGCSHIPVFEVLKSLKIRVIGDIGCYTLAALPPLNSMDTQLNMSLSIGAIYGMNKVRKTKKTMAVIGDSTFLHSGLPALLNSAQYHGHDNILILDNSSTAMTGCQDYPGAGKINFVRICNALGVNNVIVIDPYDKKSTKKIIKKNMDNNELTVFITNKPCIKKTV